MKYLIILGDGMADEPITALGDQTPLQAASKPTIDRMALQGACGRFVSVPLGYPPGSEIANLGVLGYDVRKVYEGRGSLEAASMGIALEPGELAMRCNLISVEAGLIRNHSAGHISTEEAAELIHFLQERLGNKYLNFYPGVSYRHLLTVKGGDKRLTCTPPHDVPGIPFASVLPKADVVEAAETAALLMQLILDSQELLGTHPVNLKRVAEGKAPANSIWPWSPGYRPTMLKMQETYGIRSGAVISAVDLIHGIGIYAGLDKVVVPGATGLYTTNYEGKVQATLEALKEKDFVFLHIEASDEAGHEGDVELKVSTIESLDRRVVKPLMEAFAAWDEPVTVLLLPDHPTPCRLRTHTAEPVPFVLWGPTVLSDAVNKYDEFSVSEGAYGLLRGDELIRLLLGR